MDRTTFNEAYHKLISMAETVTPETYNSAFRYGVLLYMGLTLSGGTPYFESLLVRDELERMRSKVESVRLERRLVRLEGYLIKGGLT